MATSQLKFSMVTVDNLAEVLGYHFWGFILGGMGGRKFTHSKGITFQQAPILIDRA